MRATTPGRKEQAIAAALHEELRSFQRRHNLDDEQLAHLLTGDEETVPLNIFSTGLGSLEALVRHLIDEQHKNVRDVATLLKRHYATIALTLTHARQKRRAQPSTDETPIPVAIFADRTRAPLQALVTHLHEERGMRFVDIAHALRRDPRNINTTYHQVRP